MDAPHRKRRARGRQQSLRPDSCALTRQAPPDEQCPRAAFNPFSIEYGRARYRAAASCLRGVSLFAARASPAQRWRYGRCSALYACRGRAPGSAQGSTAVFAERRAGGRVPRHPARHVRWPARDEPPTAGRRRYRQDGRRRLRAGCRGRFGHSVLRYGAYGRAGAPICR